MQLSDEAEQTPEASAAECQRVVGQLLMAAIQNGQNFHWHLQRDSFVMTGDAAYYGARFNLVIEPPCLHCGEGGGCGPGHEDDEEGDE